MTRLDHEMTLIALTLVFDGAWAMGAPEDHGDSDTVIDRPVWRDPARQAHLPGTAFAGSLRRWLDAAPTPMGEDWLGPNPDDAADGEGSRRDPVPGRLRVIGAQSGTDTGVDVHSRGTTAIDHRTGGPRGRSLRSEQYADPGTVVVLLEHGGAADQELIDRLRIWRPQLGGGGTVGRGYARIGDLRHVTADLEDRGHLHWWLTARHDWPSTSADPQETPGRPDEIVCDIPTLSARGDSDNDDPSVWSVAWTVKEPVKVTAMPSSESQAAPPLVEVNGVPTVPGSSWKGVYRHRAQTILNLIGADPTVTAQIIEHLFGAGGSGASDSEDDDTGKLGTPGALVFFDSPADSTRTQTQWHVPIDRFTGGAVSSGPFKTASLPRGARLSQVVETRTQRPLPDSVRNLLWHVAHDLHDGLIGIGGGGGRGYGWVNFRSDVDRQPMTPKPVDPEALQRDCPILEHSPNRPVPPRSLANETVPVLQQPPRPERLPATLTTDQAAWADLAAHTGITRWHWSDLMGRHLADHLPTAQPADITHLWGWGTDLAVRARYDDSRGAWLVSTLTTGAGPVTYQLLNVAVAGAQKNPDESARCSAERALESLDELQLLRVSVYSPGVGPTRLDFLSGRPTS